ncbi:hypothetical protein ACGFOU_19265 [Streptomyces sp. NPDC048595]|uniref:hypothetical protein n=1 Tax=Streptomyces sp. NPDC048595 TaxID=3365576 RepID=UPI00371CF89C
MTTGPVARAARAATFAAVCVTTTALGHALMSGSVPWWALCAAYSGTGLAAYRLTGRERGALVVTASTVAAQLGLHSLFGLAQAPPATLHVSPPTPMDVMAGMDGMPGIGVSHMGHTSPMSHTGHGTLGMFLAHVLAALVCGLWLWRGEAAAFRLTRSLAGLLFAPLLRVLTARHWTGLRLPARPLAGVPVLTLRAALLLDVVSRRGPPQPSMSS